MVKARLQNWHVIPVTVWTWSLKIYGFVAKVIRPPIFVA